LGHRQWLYIVTIVVLAIVLVGLVQAFIIMAANYDECSGGLASDTQPCLRRHLGMTSEWLNVWLVGIVVAVGLPTAWKLWTGHRTVQADERRVVIDKRASMRFAYGSTLYGLLGFLGVALIFVLFVYTNGLRQ
jgi:hypothetical protein